MNKTYVRRWLRFAKLEKMKYIGHLDLQTIFHGAIRRAKLPIAYSQGFNPHQRISFALPLPVGMESLCEYVELILEEPADVMLIDKHLPDGLRILNVYDVPEKAPRPAAEVTAVDYRLTSDLAKHAYDQIIYREEIIVLKKTKSGEKEVDIKPDILDIAYDPVGTLTMKLSAGSSRNLSPQVVINEFFPNESVSIVRTEMYANNGRPLHEIL